MIQPQLHPLPIGTRVMVRGYPIPTVIIGQGHFSTYWTYRLAGGEVVLEYDVHAVYDLPAKPNADQMYTMMRISDP